MSDTVVLLDAIKAGDRTTVERLLAQDPQLLSSRADTGVSALMTAVYYRQGPIVEAFLAHDPSLDIWEASATGRLERVVELLARDPSLMNATSPDGFSPIGLAAFFGNADVLEVLATRGADINDPSDNPMRVRPLHSAVANRDAATALASATLLLDHGAEINVAQHGGWTPLHEAAARGNVALVALLLERGASSVARSEDGRTPLDLAVAGGHEAAAGLLRAAGRQAEPR